MSEEGKVAKEAEVMFCSDDDTTKEQTGGDFKLKVLAEVDSLDLEVGKKRVVLTRRNGHRFPKEMTQERILKVFQDHFGAKEVTLHVNFRRRFLADIPKQATKEEMDACVQSVGELFRQVS